MLFIRKIKTSGLLVIVALIVATGVYLGYNDKNYTYELHVRIGNFDNSNEKEVITLDYIKFNAINKLIKLNKGSTFVAYDNLLLIRGNENGKERISTDKEEAVWLLLKDDLEELKDKYGLFDCITIDSVEKVKT